MWVLKTHGKSFYVDHVNCEISWSTKETPDNSHTKGSIKIKDCLLTIDEANTATISKLTIFDKIRLRNQRLGITRVIVHEQHGHAFRRYLKDLEIKHGPIKAIGGACTSTFYITDILEESHMTALALALVGTSFRELMPNEGYYQYYDKGKDRDEEFLWEEDFDGTEEDE
jgi:hypothetical protein